jgi:uncharacterized repeat protein (TIGR03803 family)
MKLFPVHPLFSAPLRRLCAVLLVSALCQLAAHAQTFTSLVNLDGSNGNEPWGNLIQAADGNLYGTTYSGGDLTCGPPYGCGTVFKLTPSGSLTVLHTFEGKDGLQPVAGLVQGPDGNLYGVTSAGGAVICEAVCGTIFRITTDGTFTSLYSFCSLTKCADGAMPQGSLAVGQDGNLYGTTSQGGDTSCNAPFGCGEAFMITLSGSLTPLHNFEGTDGASPQGRLVQASNGNFYGTAFAAGANSHGGDVFQMAPGGAVTAIYSFCSQPNCADGSAPFSNLVIGKDGNLYGTTSNGGNVTCAPPVGCGTIFKITTGGTLTTLYSFCTAANCPDGTNPFAGLVLGSDGNFYGTTTAGGNTLCNLGCGTVFSMTPSGQLTTLHTFTGTDGSDPQAALVQASDGALYGGTLYGGANVCNSVGCGTFFRVAVSAGKISTGTQLQVAPSTIDQGSTSGVTLSAIVTASSGSGTPTGTVTFYNGTTQIGQPENLSGGSSTVNYDTSSLAAKTYSITATYSGDNSYSGSTSLAETLTVTSAQGATTTSLSITATPSSTQSDLGSSVTLSATVSHASGSASPTGTITFLNGSTTLGTGALSGGVATFTTSSLSANQYSVTASYSGDNNYSDSISEAETLDVVDFQLSGPSTLSVSSPGQSTSAGLTIAPLDGFSQAITYSCAGLPASAQCSFVTTSNGATMTVSTTAPSSAIAVNHASEQNRGSIRPLLLTGLLGVFAAGAFRRKSDWMRMLLVLVILCFGSLCTGCGALASALGGGGGTGIGNSGTPVGTSTITVSATAGSLSHQTTINFTVQ